MSLFSPAASVRFHRQAVVRHRIVARRYCCRSSTCCLPGGLPLGIDFSGGTLLVLEFEQPTAEDSVRDALVAMDDKVVQQYGDTGNGILIRLPQSGPEQGTSLELGAEQVVSTLESSGLGEFEVISRELVGPVIGQELQQRGMSAFLFAMAAFLIYVGLRFRFSFGIGAIVAVAHDILVTLSLLTMFGYELSLNVVAAMLTITGYSVNDSIVVFDRVRENLRAMRRDKFDQLVNTSINQTLARTIITSGTTRICGACPVPFRWRGPSRVRLHDVGGRDQRNIFDDLHCHICCHCDYSEARGAAAAGDVSLRAGSRAAEEGRTVAAVPSAGQKGPRIVTSVFLV